ncbi:6802_t:CDS:1, partial [Cetraspora pellucida]
KKIIKRALNELKNYLTIFNRTIAKKFGISETTLKHAIKNKGPLNYPEFAKVLTDYEKQQLVSYCLNMQKLDFGLTRSGINHYVIEIINKSKKQHSFNKSELSKL